MNNILFRALGTCCLTFLLAVGNSASAAENVSRVTVELTGLATETGVVFIAVFDSPDTWLGDEALTHQEVDITESLEGEVVRSELQLPPGEYALLIFYDSNGNGELDTNFIGIPKEPIAMSNNAKMKFGPPKYEDAVFTLGSEAIVQRISVKEL